MNHEFKQVPVAILCGGRGLVLDTNQAERLNKGLVSIAGAPLFLWVMRHYALYGATHFLLATGLQGDRFGSALLTAGASRMAEGYDIELAGHMCQVRLVPTPPQASTADRLLACRPWLEQAPRFALTYSDTLSDVDLGKELSFHLEQNLIATLVAAPYPVRFRILGMRQGETRVRAFAPRPVIETTAINGGYYLFTRQAWDPVHGLAPGTAMENECLEHLAAAGQLAAFEHRGAWQHCDSERDLFELERVAGKLRVAIEKMAS